MLFSANRVLLWILDTLDFLTICNLVMTLTYDLLASFLPKVAVCRTTNSASKSSRHFYKMCSVALAFEPVTFST